MLQKKRNEISEKASKYILENTVGFSYYTTKYSWISLRYLSKKEYISKMKKSFESACKEALFYTLNSITSSNVTLSSICDESIDNERFFLAEQLHFVREELNNIFKQILKDVKCRVSVNIDNAAYSLPLLVSVTIIFNDEKEAALFFDNIN